MKKRRLALTALLAAGLGAAAPAPALATCQNIQNQTINVGHARRTIKDGVAESVMSYLFTQGNGWTAETSGLNFGINRTLGYLPSGAQYNLWFAASHIDLKTSIGAGSCFDSSIVATLSAQAGDFCSGVINGPWVLSYNVNTCGMLDGVFRGLVQIGFQALGYAPSWRTFLEVKDRTASSALSLSSGCHRVATTGGASGCSDSI